MHGETGLEEEMVAIIPRLRRFALGLCGTPDDADDLLQATCERAIRSLDRFEAGTRLDSWMFRIMQNLFKNSVRDRGVHDRAIDRACTCPADSAFDGARAMEAHIDLKTAGGVLATMEPDQRAVLLLVAVEGLSYEETARIVEAPVGTVTSRLARARATLRRRCDAAIKGRP